MTCGGLMTSNTDALELKSAADALREANRLDEALATYDEAIRLRQQFWGAHYYRGDVLLKQGRFLEAASAFANAWLFSRFRAEPGVMCARALALARFSTEAVAMFERVPLEEFDPFSVLMYAEALLREGRARDALVLAPRFATVEDNAKHRVLGAIYLDIGDVARAEQELVQVRATDPNGYVYDRLLAVYFARGEWDRADALLSEAAERYGNDYYSAQLIALRVLRDQPLPAWDWQQFGRRDLVDAALYFKPHVAAGLRLTGLTYQTFALLREIVPAEGLLLEFGVRNGHTLTYLAELFGARRWYGFDSFEGLPEAWHKEEAGSYSALGRLPPMPAHVELIAGWFAETLPPFKAAHPEPIAFMNVDCDLYSATKTIFDALDRQIVPGTVIVFDEYIGNKTWREDEFKAFQEWVVAHGVRYQYLVASFYSKQVAVRILARGDA